MPERTMERDAAIISYTVSGLVLLVWIARIVVSVRQQLWFDDAFMFYRYAWNMRHGLGVSWNPDGVRTYGETAQLWAAVVWLLSYLPAPASTVLLLGSWLSSIAAAVAIAWAVARNAASAWMSSTWRVLALVAAPLAWTPIFIRNTLNGMETMLAAALCAWFLGLVLGMVLNGGSRRSRPVAAGVAGLLLVLTRPEAAIVVLLFPLCAWLLLPGGSRRALFRLFSVVAAGVAVDLIACKLYFHIALPLSFYVKAQQGYEGYTHDWHPTVSLFRLLAGCLPYLVMLAAVARRADIRLLIAFFLPLLAVSFYLGSVLQIMGFYSRYYLPYLPLIVVPALLLLDRSISTREHSVRPLSISRRTLSRRTLVTRALAICLLVGLLGFATVRDRLALAVDRHTEKPLYGYDAVTLNNSARSPLPELAWQTVAPIADLMVAHLPPGAIVAASEVGYLGAAAPQVEVVDLEGLNDTAIALHGFDPARLFAQKPDLIWLPHQDYTWQRGVILTDPSFFRDYEVVAGAANSGVAIRKDSPNRPQLERDLKILWSKLYPGVPIAGYVATSATWTKRKFADPDN